MCHAFFSPNAITHERLYRRKPNVQYAYITIAEFFGTYALADAHRYLEKMLKTAGSFHYWHGNPSNVLFFFEKLEGLVRAALTIHREESQREAAVVPLARARYLPWQHMGSIAAGITKAILGIFSHVT